MKYLVHLIIPILLFAGCITMFQLEFWHQLERKAYDSLFQLRGPIEVSKDIVIVAIDDDTFSTLDMQWPFPRELHARLIDNLQQAGARQIIFDIEFTESSNSISDSILAETAAKYDNVIFAGKILKDYSNRYVREQLLDPVDVISSKKLPWGLVNMFIDSDGFVRQYNLEMTYGKDSYNTLGIVSLVMENNNSKFTRSSISKTLQEFIINSGKKDKLTGEIRIPRFKSQTALINFYGPAKTFPTYSFANVVDDSTYEVPTIDFDAFNEHLTAGTFEDKIVLVGATIEELHDTFNTPYMRMHTLTPGVEIHANFIEMCKNRDFLYAPNMFVLLLIQLVFAIAAYILFLKIKPNISFIFLLVFMGGALYGTYYAFAEKSYVFPVLEVPALVFVIYVVTLVVQYIRSLKERRFIKHAFQQYIAPDLVDELLKNPGNLEYGGSLRELSVLFSDIRSFTTYTESHSPRETVTQLREYLTAMVEIILRHSGTLDKFVGDEIMALFGAPVDLENHALSACRVALEMRDKLTQLQEKWINEGKDIFEIGIGVNSGFATVGNLGSEQIFDYTAIGDCINLGARLEAINKQYATKKKIIISEFTYEIIKEEVIAEFLDEVQVKGKNQFVKIYQLIGLKQI